MSLAEIATAVGGTVSDGDRDVVVTAPAFSDSRTPVTGGLFVAIAGERVDGHDYAPGAVAAGAAGVLASRALDVPAVVVPDVQDALGALARHLLARMDGLTVIGLTGSQGKTSTKDMLGAVLGAVAPTVAPEGSFNTEIGVPLTALRVTPQTRYLVVEMGARGVGHIGYLAGIVAPTIGLVLNVGVAHLGEFGSRNAIAVAKGELVEALPPSGLAVLNADDPRVAAMASRTRAQVLTFGTAPSADLRVGDVGIDDQGHTRFTLTWDGRREDVTMQYVGEHHALNAAGAAAVALGSGLDLAGVAASLREARPLSKWRMELTVRSDGVLVVNDTYNANPDSMRAALRAAVDIAKRRGGARVVAVLGDMRELGDATEREHSALGNFAAELGVPVLVTVGESTRPLYDAAIHLPSWAGTAYLTRDEAEALDLLRGALREGDVVLVKASRAAGLEGLAAALAADPEPGARRKGVG